MDENVQVSALFPDPPPSCHATHSLMAERSPQACVTSFGENDKSEDKRWDFCKSISNESDTPKTNSLL